MQIEKMALSITEAAKLLGVSRPTMYTLVNRADFPSFRVGSRRLIPVDGLRDWMAKQASGGEAVI